MPEKIGRMAEHADGVDAVLVAIAGGKLENGEVHFNFQLVILNHRVAQKFMARPRRVSCAHGLLVAVQFDFEIFADVDGLDAAVAHLFEGALDGFALRVHDGFFRCDDDFCFHARAEGVSGFKPQVSSLKFPASCSIVCT